MGVEAAASSYIYEDLKDPSVNVRLVSIRSACPGKIECSLRQVPNVEHKKYNCLSYTCGDPFGRDSEGPRVQITCNGGHITIRQNLYDAILHLFPLQKEKLAVIWIDAICIRQDDPNEKRAQMRLMHDIYANAESVIIWLGPDDQDESIIPKFHEVAQTVRHQNLGGHDQSSNWDAMYAMGHEEKIDKMDLPLLSSIDAETWRAVGDLVTRRAYWRRLWVWQEVMAAKEDPIVVCGRHILSWKDLRDVSHVWTVFGIGAMRRPGEPHSNILPAGMSLINLPYQLARWRDYYRDPQNGVNGRPSMRWKFGTLVFQINRNAYVCEDERDKIYAHIGICEYDKLEGWGYEKPFWELYTHFWSDIMDRTKEVNFLTFIEDASARMNRPKMSYDKLGKSVPALPSWVPDLRASLEPGSMWDAYRDNELFNISKGLAGKREEADETINDLAVDRDLCCLKLRGFSFDTIEQFGESTDDIEHQQSMPYILELIIDILSEPSRPYDSLKEVFDAIWSSISILADTDPSPSFPVTPDRMRRARDWFLHKLAHSSIQNVHNIYAQKQDQLLGRLRELLGRLGEVDLARPFQSLGIEQYTAGMKARAAGDFGLRRMRLFRTWGNWIGKGPQSMRVGDEIWIMPGAQVAFILRRGPTGKCHEYVGHAYVHGIMQGEACSRFDNVEPEHIKLV